MKKILREPLKNLRPLRNSQNLEVFQRFLSIVTGLVAFTVINFSAYAFYNDVSTEHPYYTYIAVLYDSNRLPLTESFRPDDKLTKADLYTFILSYSGAPLSTTVDLPYEDTGNTTGYSPYIQTALDLKVITKSAYNTKFEPEKQTAKNNALEIMFKTLGVGVPTIFDRNGFYFTDIGPGSWAGPLANTASELGILEPDNPAKFRLAKRITRAEAAYYLYKISQYYPQDQTITIDINTSGNNGYSTTENKLIDNLSFGTLLDVWSSIKDKYLLQEEVNDQKLIFGAIKGMVGELSDKYTVFQEPDEKIALTASLSSEYEGIGIVIEMIDGKVTIVAPIKDSPAEKAGIKANDVIKAVDGDDIEGLTLESVSNKVKGASGSSVKIKIIRGTGELEFSVTRDFILLKTVESETLANNIAYINIKSFAQNTYIEFMDAAKSLKAKNPKGFIVDVRNNPGGFLDVAVNVSNAFVGENKTIVSLEYADGSKEEYKSNSAGLLKDDKIVVLVNEGTASAAEILAGALQDLNQATIIGTKTFGKGSAQELKEYKDNSLFKYTVSNWLTPNGHNINGTGITPDKTVQNPNGTDVQLEAAKGEF